MKKILLYTLVITGCFQACESEDDPSSQGLTASFDITMDENIPGKVILMNRSVNADTYFWNLWLADENNGEPYISNSYTRSTSFDENSFFFIQENQWILIELTASSLDEHMTVDQYFEVTNIPGKVTIDQIELTYVNPLDPSGNSWDGTGDNPDISVITIPTSTCPGRFSIDWNVDIENGLPFILSAVKGTESRSDISVQASSEFFLHFVDAEGSPQQISCQPITSMGVVRFNPYSLTHKANKGNDDNFARVYEIETPSVRANLHMTWE
ncbi:hypothetical protein FNH22_08500 [Fulvivirga sp. M361]|uniref:hypothetical protein n=1 Tax=Fulvivirga sp. M361 TaxID=2594266 RepID=UPI00117A0674|nr:hypothetical protein [Fulvivirga sp. M361]TRX60080.1 hypothetical protein FNH22_08500 [Fulvivirga sp. M361]